MCLFSQSRVSYCLSLLLFVFVSAYSSVAISDPSVSVEGTLPSKESPLFVSTSNVMPWGIEDSKGNHGLLVELAKQVQQASSLPMKNRLKPYPRVILDIQRGNADLAVLFNSPQSRQIGTSLGQVIEVEIIAIGKRGLSVATSLDQLDGLRVAYVRGSKYGAEFDHNSALRKVPVKNANQGLMMLMKGHVDIVVSTDQSIYYGVDFLGIDPKQLTKVYKLSTATADLFLSKQSKYQPLIPKLQTIVSKLKKEGVLNDIFYSRDYLSSDLINSDDTFEHESKRLFAHL